MGAPRAPNKETSLKGTTPTSQHGKHETTNLSYLAAAKGQLTPAAPRVFRKPSDIKPDINCRQSEPATSSPKFISIFKDPLSPTSPLIYKTGSSDFSVAYTVPSEHRHLQVEFLSKLRQEFPYGIGYAIQHKEEGNELSVEVALASEDYCRSAVQNPIIMEDTIFPAIRTIPSSLTRFNFSGVPMESPTETRETIQKIFSRYGKVVDIVL
ncbi:hypothetical protein BY458DRAFT_411572, partial [Sporodiniella umbellata]